jgi:hypothetical protein
MRFFIWIYFVNGIFILFSISIDSHCFITAFMRMWLGSCLCCIILLTNNRFLCWCWEGKRYFLCYYYYYQQTAQLVNRNQLNINDYLVHFDISLQIQIFYFQYNTYQLDILVLILIYSYLTI